MKKEMTDEECTLIFSLIILLFANPLCLLAYGYIYQFITGTSCVITRHPFGITVTSIIICFICMLGSLGIIEDGPRVDRGPEGDGN